MEVQGAVHKAIEQAEKRTLAFARKYQREMYKMFHKNDWLKKSIETWGSLKSPEAVIECEWDERNSFVEVWFDGAGLYLRFTDAEFNRDPAEVALAHVIAELKETAQKKWCRTNIQYLQTRVQECQEALAEASANLKREIEGRSERSALYEAFAKQAKEQGFDLQAAE